MAITFHPVPGTILMCDFSSGFITPEMVKSRPVIVISPKLKRCSGLCTVVAISTSRPDPIENWHLPIEKSSMPATEYFQRDDSWVKGDMIYRVSFGRLNLIKLDRDPVTKKRGYFKQILAPEELRNVQSCVLHALNLGRLKEHL